MAEIFYEALGTALAEKGMSVAELSNIPGAGSLPYRAEQRSPHVTLNDVYAASRVLDVIPLVAVKEGQTVIPVNDNAAALRALRGDQTVSEHIRDTDLPYSTYYEMQRGSRPALTRVIDVWNQLGYDVKFLEPKPEPTVYDSKTVRDVSFPKDLMALNQAQVTELLRRHFPNE